MLKERVYAKVTERQRIAVECLAYDIDSSLGEATRRILDAGISALGLLEDEAVKC